jgi:hypothetical protein
MWGFMSSRRALPKGWMGKEEASCIGLSLDRSTRTERSSIIAKTRQSWIKNHDSTWNGVYGPGLDFGSKNK